MNKAALAMVVLLVVGVAVISACGGADTGTGTEGPAEQPRSLAGDVLLEERCSTCHSLDRVTTAQKTRGDWEETVLRMVDRGAELNDEEVTVLVDYLAETYGP